MTPKTANVALLPQVVESLCQPPAVLRDSVPGICDGVLPFLLALQSAEQPCLLVAKQLHRSDLALQYLLVDDVLLALLNETALLALQVRYIVAEPGHSLAQVSVARLGMALYHPAEYLRVPDGV